jgi:methyltransferase-like protein/SAM-dependent methyltransferase
MVNSNPSTSQKTKSATIYDELNYPELVFQHIRPELIFAAARLHGLECSNAQKPRVLEIGCASGANLLSIAYNNPYSDCFGIDLSQNQIAEAEKSRLELGIENIRFKAMDLLDLDLDSEFDLIIAHGFYSWVPELVRTKLFETINKNLARDGVAFISYNALPGFYIRQILRDAALFHTETISESRAKIYEARKIIEFLKASAPSETLASQIFTKESENTSEKVDSVLFHDDLAPINDAFYFQDFVKTAGRFGLKYICESELRAGYIKYLPSEIQQALQKIKNDPLRYEQYLDFIRLARFRSSLLCRSENEISHTPLTEGLKGLCFTTQLITDAKESALFDNSQATFIHPIENVEIKVNHPLIKTFLSLLFSVSPRFVYYSEITGILKEKISLRNAGDFESMLQGFDELLLDLCIAQLVECRVNEPIVAERISSKPMVSALARWQVNKGLTYATSLLGKNMVPPDNLMRFLIANLNGERTAEEIISASKANGLLKDEAVSEEKVLGYINQLFRKGFLLRDDRSI